MCGFLVRNMVFDCSISRFIFVSLVISSESASRFIGNETRKFPPGFKFAAASSAYQIEGAYNESGKGWSVWDTYTHSNLNKVAERGNADVACDSYHKYKEDVQLLKTLGFDMYRFSISWPRIMPKGTSDEINQEGVDYYHNLIDELLNNGIEPMVTMFHFDTPQHLQHFGGWLNEKIVDYFADYAEFLFQTYGYKMMALALGYGDDDFVAPALGELHGYGEYIAGHNILKAHAKVYNLYQAKYKYQDGKISTPLIGNNCLPKTSSAEDKEAQERCLNFFYGWFLNPIFGKTGDYPEVMKTQIAKLSKQEGITSRLPAFTQEEIDEIKGTGDFVAINAYVPSLVTKGFDLSAKNPSVDRDSEVIRSADPSWPSESLPSFRVDSKSLRATLKWIKEIYGDLPIFISESGYVDKGSLIDDGRIYFFETILNELKDSIFEDEVNVIGYTVWSLMDSFELLKGYTAKFGLVHVDFDNPKKTRTLKKSALWFKQYMTQNRI